MSINSCPMAMAAYAVVMNNSGRYPSSVTTTASTAAGWALSTVLAPSALFGANGMQTGPDGQRYVAQAFGSQISALDLETGAARTVVPVGSTVVAPDDLAFDSQGVMYITEVMGERVSARMSEGSLRVIAENVPVANGITTHGDRVFKDEFRPGGRLLELSADGRAPRVIWRRWQRDRVRSRRRPAAGHRARR